MTQELGEIQRVNTFLTGSKHNFVRSKIFNNLKNNELALRLEVARTGTNLDVYYKVLSFETFFDLIKNNRVPLRSLSCKEMVFHTKPHIKFFMVVKNWNTQLLSLKGCKDLLRTTFLNFWVCHSFLKHYKVNATQNFILMERSFPEEHVSYLRLIVDKYCFPQKYIFKIVQEYQNFITHLLPIQNYSETEFFYFQSIIKDQQLGILDCTVYQKNTALLLLQSLEVLRDPFLTITLRKKVLDPSSALTIRSDTENFFMKLQQSLVTFVDYCQVLPYEATQESPICLSECEETKQTFSSSSLQGYLTNLLVPFLHPIRKILKTHRDVKVKVLTYVIRQEYIDCICQIFDGLPCCCDSSPSTMKKSSISLLLSIWAISIQSTHQCHPFRFWYPLTCKTFMELLQYPEVHSFMVDDELSCENFFKKYKMKENSTKNNWILEEYHSPIVKDYFETPYKWHLEQSGMCTQKTIKWLELIKKWESKNFSYCIIGPRISFVTNTYHRLQTFLKDNNCILPFHIYQTKKFRKEVLLGRERSPPSSYMSPLTAGSTRQRPINVIITYESLWQIAHYSFDVVIIDEITTVLSCVTSATNHDKLQINAATFHSFLTNSKHALLLDADLNAKCLDMVCIFQNPWTEKVLFRKNTYRNPEIQKTILFYTDRPKILEKQHNVFSVSYLGNPTTKNNKQKKEKVQMKKLHVEDEKENLFLTTTETQKKEGKKQKKKNKNPWIIQENNNLF